MDAEVKAKCLAALRSGKYQQAQGWLRDSDGFCCLGVIADVTAPEKWVACRDNTFHHDGHAALLSDRFRESIGMRSSLQDKLTSMNDEGKSFTEIADWIEANA